MEVTIEKLVYGGDGMSRLPDGRAVFVSGVLPGEKVKIRLTAEKKGYANATLQEIVLSSPERIEAPCPYFGVCGGCHYQFLSYDRQLFYKTDIVRQQLNRLAGITNCDELVMDIVASPKQWHYRNNVQFHIHPDGRLGFQMAASDSIVPIEKCLLIEEAIDAFSKHLDFEFIADMDRISIRRGADDDILLMIEGEDLRPPSFSVDFPLSAVYVSPEREYLMTGDDYTLMEISGRPFKVSARSFFQVNTFMAEKMVETMLDYLELSPEMNVLDIYCGVGLFSAFLADKVAKCVGIEISEFSTADYADNLDEFDNVELFIGPAEEILPNLEFNPDVIILDPPRSGLNVKVIDWLKTCEAKTLFYVSCDVATLARDIRRLGNDRYQVIKVLPFDLFPQTYHIETMVIFEKKQVV